MKLQLTIGEMFSCQMLLLRGQREMNLMSLKDSLAIMELLTITDDIKKSSEWKDIKDDKGNIIQNEWSPKYTATLEFSRDEVKLLQELIAKQDEEKKFTMQDGKNMVDFVEKVKNTKE